jgi:hypothetical protein
MVFFGVGLLDPVREALGGLRHQVLPCRDLDRTPRAEVSYGLLGGAVLLAVLPGPARP